MLPTKLRYRGRLYLLQSTVPSQHTAETDVGRLWRTEIVPKLEKCLEVAANKEIADFDKLESFTPIWQELRSTLRQIGLY